MMYLPLRIAILGGFILYYIAYKLIMKLDLGNKVKVRERVLLSGLASSAQIIGFNPELGQLKSWTGGDRELTKAPSYFTESQGVTKFRLDVWFKLTYFTHPEGGLLCYNPNNGDDVESLKESGILTDNTKRKVVFVKDSIWLADVDQISMAGSNQKIDVHGNASYPNKEGQYNYMNNHEGRKE